MCSNKLGEDNVTTSVTDPRFGWRTPGAGQRIAA
jgi:hypothetical protein